VVIAQGLAILSKIELENFSAHIIGNLVTNPEDNKADNYVIKIYHDAKGNLEKFKLCCIDNDKAFVDSIVQYQGRHYTQLKSIIYAIDELMQQPVAAAIKTKLLQAEPLALVITWLSRMLAQQRRYDYLRNDNHSYGQVIAAELFNELKLNKQIVPGFAKRLLQRLLDLQQLLRQGSITHWKLFEQLEPLLSRHYQVLHEKQHSAHGVISMLYNKQEEPQLEVTLAKQLQERLILQPLLGQEATTIAAALEKEQRRPQEAQAEWEKVSWLVNEAKSFIEAVMPQVTLSSSNPLSLELITALSDLAAALPTTSGVLQMQQLTTTKTTLEQAYQHNQQGIIILLRTLKQIRIIDASSKRQEQITLDLANDYQVLTQVLQLQSAALLELFAASGNDIHQRDGNGHTVIHYAARYLCSFAIVPLVTAGALVNSSTCDPLDEKPLPLDKAVGELLKVKDIHEAITTKEACIATIKELLRYGAFMSNVALGKEFIKYSYSQEFNNFCNSHEDTQYLRKQLILQSQSLAFTVGLEALSQDKPSFLQNIYVKYIITDKEKYLIAEETKKIFNQEGFPRENIYGRHKVAKIIANAHGVDISFHVKENPELPGFELMVGLLHQITIGHGAPDTALLEISKEEGIFIRDRKSYPALISNTIDGENFKDALLQVDASVKLQQLDSYYLSNLILIIMLTNLEDNKPDNCIIEPCIDGRGKQSYRLTLIDNDHAFVQDVKLTKDGVDEDKGTDLQVKSIVFCLEQMLDKVDAKAKTVWLRLEPYTILKQWLELIEQRVLRQQQLFDKDKSEELERKKIYLNPQLTRSLITNLYHKLNLIQQILRHKSNITHLELLRRVSPLLGRRSPKCIRNHYHL
jgi:hypothetical protein